VPKVAQICEIIGNFGYFLPGNKDSNPCLEDPDFLSPAKKGQRVGFLNPNPWISNNTIRLYFQFVSALQVLYLQRDFLGEKQNLSLDQFGLRTAAT
jgi:hypothetical protein